MAYVAAQPKYDADVIIAGAGPAGAAAACHLAHSGASVILLDRAAFPRDKVCGDFVGPSALVELDSLGISRMDAYARTNIARRAALYIDGEELISRPFPEIEGLPSHGRVIPRIALDSFVVDAARSAGARLIQGSKLTSFLVNGDAVSVELATSNGPVKLRCRVLIGADGSSSAVARLMRGSAPPRRDRFIAARAYFDNVEGPDDQLDVYFDRGCYPGFYWLFPTGNGEANVGLGLALETWPAHNFTPAAMLRRLMHEDAALAARLRNARLRGTIVGWPLMTYNHRLPIVSDRVMLIGDAASLINPLNGEGIQYALLSARWAAEVLAPCLRSDDFSARALAPFAARVEREMRYDMALSRFIVQLISNRALTPLWIAASKILAQRAHKDANTARIVSGIFAGLLPARDAWKVVGGTTSEAVRSLASNAVTKAFSGPRGWAGQGADAAQENFQLAGDASMDSSEFARWLIGAAACTLELGAQAARNAIAGQPHMSSLHPSVLPDRLKGLLKHGFSFANFAKAAPRRCGPGDGQSGG
ncbi:MAG TPA: geranylgeranyl reductase family protein [Methylocella sp.]|jgi:geranylgeranyl reductase family protein